MEKFVLLLVLLSPAASDVVRVKPGDDVTLPCQAGEASISAVEWTRPDLEPEYVLFYRDGRSDPTYQHSSFKDRVQLVDRELKDGDVSLILKNVSRNDAGTYECRVAAGGSRRKRAIIETDPISIIQLEVSGKPTTTSPPSTPPPGSHSSFTPTSPPGSSPLLVMGSVLSFCVLILLGLLVLLVLLVRRCLHRKAKAAEVEVGDDDITDDITYSDVKISRHLQQPIICSKESDPAAVNSTVRGTGDISCGQIVIKDIKSNRTREFQQSQRSSTLH